MKKGIFTTTEAQLVGFDENPLLVNLQLHQWRKSDEITSLKRGLFMFTDYRPKKPEVAKTLREPCYFSLEYALSVYGIIPEAVFTHTLVTTKAGRRFETPEGVFEYHKIKHEAFAGFDSKTLMADKEKALVDYFYLRGARFQPNDIFWGESRLEASTTGVNFKKVFRYANLFGSKKLNMLLNSFYNYAKSHQNHR